MIWGYCWSKLTKVLQGKTVRGSKVSKKAFVNYGSNVVNSFINAYSYCGYDCWIIETEIGKYCSISNHVKIGGPAHPVDWVSTSPVFHSPRNILGLYYKNDLLFNPFAKTIIGNDVWIGQNTIIKAGVTIGDGAIIGAGSVVTKNIPPYEIWAGNPARCIRRRFDTETATAIQRTQWWNLPEEALNVLSPYFSDPCEFLKAFSLGRQE